MEFLIERFKKNQDSTAFIHNNISYSYGDIVNEMEYFSQMLSQQKILAGDVVLIIADYDPKVFSLLLALALNKNIVVPLTFSSVVELSEVQKISEANWLVRFSQKDNSINFEKLNQSPVNPLTLSLIEKNEPGLILFSSGSTGKPKGIIHNFNKVINKFEKQRQGMVAIVFLMLDHFGGINTLFGITSSLGTVVTIDDRSVVSVCEAIQKYKVELLPTTPSFLNLLAATNLHKDYSLNTLKRITYGTEVMSQMTLRKLQLLFPNVLFQQTYGLSELGVLSSKSRNDGSLWVKLGGDGFQLKIENGTLWIKSEFAMLGYLNSDSPFIDGWFNTQDSVEVEGEYFKILGRVTDLINVGGQKVYPAEIESIIMTISNIEDVAVYSEPNPLLGNIICAKVKLVNEESLASVKKRIRLECLAKLTSYKVPSKVLISEEGLYSTRMKKVRR